MTNATLKRKLTKPGAKFATVAVDLDGKPVAVMHTTDCKDFAHHYVRHFNRRSRDRLPVRAVCVPMYR